MHCESWNLFVGSCSRPVGVAVCARGGTLDAGASHNNNPKQSSYNNNNWQRQITTVWYAMYALCVCICFWLKLVQQGATLSFSAGYMRLLCALTCVCITTCIAYCLMPAVYVWGRLTVDADERELWPREHCFLCQSMTEWIRLLLCMHALHIILVAMT